MTRLAKLDAAVAQMPRGASASGHQYFAELVLSLTPNLYELGSFAGQREAALFAEALVPATATERIVFVRTVVGEVSEHGPHGAPASMRALADEALSRGRDRHAATLFNLATALEHAQPSDNLRAWQRRNWSGEGVSWSIGETPTRTVDGSAATIEGARRARPRRRVRRIDPAEGGLPWARRPDRLGQ